MSDTLLTAEVIRLSRKHLIEESVPRILKCIDLLTDEELWHRHNDSVASLGNLILHLCGNVRQWIISGLGGAEDNRERQQEFDERRRPGVVRLHETNRNAG